MRAASLPAEVNTGTHTLPRQRVFRRQAIEHLEAGFGPGDVMRMSPTWERRSYTLLLWAFAAALVVSLVGSVHEYASGPALVQVEGRTDLMTPTGGSVLYLHVQPGQLVQTGDVLVQFYDAEERGEVDRIGREFELELARVLRDPTDEGARRGLVALRARKELAEARLRERTLRAPSPGTISDLRIRRGQFLERGAVVLSIIPADARYSVLTLLPGHYRPLLQPGTPLRLEVATSQFAYLELTVAWVGDQVVGPAEARRFLGQDQLDAIPIDGPVVLARANLPRPTFEVDGHQVRFYSGLPARAHVRVRESSILFTLIPALRELFHDAT